MVYAVVYSLLLLNTDLHVAQGNYARMTKQAFVKNTMSTIYDQSSVKITKPWGMSMESYLKVTNAIECKDRSLISTFF